MSNRKKYREEMRLARRAYLDMSWPAGINWARFKGKKGVSNNPRQIFLSKDLEGQAKWLEDRIVNWSEGTPEHLRITRRAYNAVMMYLAERQCEGQGLIWRLANE